MSLLQNKNLIIAAGGVVFVVVVLGVFLSMNRTVETPSGGTTEPKAESTGLDSSRGAVVTLNAQNNSGQTGIAVVGELDGSAYIVLTVEGTPEGVAQPAHIHTGSCADLGGVEYSLTSVAEGLSETRLDVPLDQLLGEFPLAINVHKSVEEASVYVACGDIEEITQ